jgi:hypothetical protein
VLRENYLRVTEQLTIDNTGLVLTVNADQDALLVGVLPSTDINLQAST